GRAVGAGAAERGSVDGALPEADAVTAPVADIGALNRRLVLEAPVESGDGAGGVVRSYEAIATLWAQITPVAASGDVAADSLGAKLRHRIVLRGPTGTIT